MFEERPGPESGLRSPQEILALLTRLDDEYAASLQRPEPIAPLTDQEPIAPLTQDELSEYESPGVVGAEEDPEPAPLVEPEIAAEEAPETAEAIAAPEKTSAWRQKLRRAVGSVTLAAVGVVGAGLVYIGGKPIFDQWQASKELAQKSKVLLGKLPVPPETTSLSPAASPSSEAPSPSSSPTPEAAPGPLEHPIAAEWLIMDHGGQMMQIPVQTKPGEDVQNWHIPGSPVVSSLPSPEGTFVGPDGVERKKTEFVTLWDQVAVGSAEGAYVTGHTWGSGAGVFDYLPSTKVGDVITFVGLDGNHQHTALTYQAVKVVTVPKSDPEGIRTASAQMPPEVTLHLVTCDNSRGYDTNPITGEKSSFDNAVVGYKLIAANPAP